MLHEFLLDSVRVSARLIHFVDRYYDRYSCSLGVADGLYCLRHYTVISSYYEYRYICDLRASRTHGRECFVTRCIKEDDLLAVDLDLGSTDVLCDTAGLACSNISITDSIEERCLTMVYVAHYSDNRRTRLEFALCILMCIDARLFELRFFLCNYNIESEVVSEHLDCILIKGLVDSSHDSHLHH